MTGPSRSVYDILNARLKVTQEIAAENVEHLRLNQIASGLMVLEMKDREDGIDSTARMLERADNAAAIDRCMDRINRLEAELAKLNRELAATAQKED